MAVPDKPTVRPWLWNPQRDRVPGAHISNGRSWLFVPLDDLYRVADALVDIAEANERGTVMDLKRGTPA
ncbi:hypothetical protein [Kocuria sp. KH4]